jgi:hypothetical protein
VKAKWVPSSAAWVVVSAALAVQGHAQMADGIAGFKPLENQMNTIHRSKRSGTNS